MRILFLVPYTPNPIRTRPYNLIRSLGRRGHEVTVLTLVENDAEQTDVQKLAGYCSKVIALPHSRWRALLNCALALPSRTPLQSVFSWHPPLMKELQSLANNANGDHGFDIVHVEHLRGARYGLTLKAHDHTSLPVIWDSVDCISHLFNQASSHSRSRFGRLIGHLEESRTASFEARLVSVFDQTLVTSETDRRALLALSSENDGSTVQVLPNGVDLHYFTVAEALEREEATLVVSGKMSYHANVTMVLDLITKIMPRVWSQESQVKLWIVGKDPGPQIQALAQHPNITVTGTVPDIRPYLQQATIAVAPLAYGAGIQNKVLEAMACATPVITSSQGVAALAARPGRDLILAADTEAFADAILELLRNPERQRAIGQSGRAYVETHHSWSAIAAKLEGIYADTCRAHGTKVGKPVYDLRTEAA